jgi:hypothetical protein
MTSKKELIKNYKQTVLPMGVFQIKNTANDKIFIGSAKNLPGIFNSNKFQLKNGMHRNKELQNDYTLFGENNFLYEILDYLEPKEDPAYNYTEDLRELEALWKEKLQPYDGKGYNKRTLT